MRRALGWMLLGLALPSAALAGNKEGFEAWQRGDYASAVAEWKAPAAAGSADAQFNLGQAYKLGRGVTQDLSIAQGWYEKAAAQGHELAQANLGLILFQKGDRQAAMPWLQKAADRGEPRAQYVVGTALFNGDLLPRNLPLAYAMMTQSAASGLAQSKTSLAQMDKYIPEAERTKGLTIAQTMQKQNAGSLLAGNGTAPTTKPAAISPVALVSTTAPSKHEAPPPPPPKPASASAPVANHAADTAPAPAKPAPAKAPVAAAATTPTGKWKIQLGAYSAAGGAQSMWQNLTTKAHGLAGLHPIYVKAGPVTRLQAGPLESQAAAEKACALAKGAGQGCFTIAP